MHKLHHYDRLSEFALPDLHCVITISFLAVLNDVKTRMFLKIRYRRKE